MLMLTMLQRRNLKARAHPLKPTVLVGSAGLTSSVLQEVAQALKSHELIKVRVMSDDREERAAMLEQICTTLNAGAVQSIGKILVIYQPQAEVPEKKKPRRKAGHATKKMLGSR
ncbi:MAG: ribosome assembly RNA-binding protein YhbY [Pseudomonadota bacterium]